MMSNVLPSEAIAQEVFNLDPTPKAMLLNELASTVLEAQEGLQMLPLSADATQWIKSLTLIDSLTIIECLAHSLKSKLIFDLEKKNSDDGAWERSFAEFRAEQGHETCPCGDMDVYSCSGCDDFIETFIDILPDDLTGIDLGNFNY